MDKFKNKYRIRSARLENRDYSSPDYYYVTICTHNRIEYFGEIADGNMKLSKTGRIAEEYWQEIPKHYPNTALDAFIVMPNHIHGIIAINNNLFDMDNNGCHCCCRDAINGVSTMNYKNIPVQQNTGGGITGKYNPMNKNSLSKIIRWHKGRTSYEINNIKNNQYFKWQPRFYDHIIRNEKSLFRIRQYIINNPANWEFDVENDKLKDKRRDKSRLYKVCYG